MIKKDEYKPDQSLLGDQSSAPVNPVAEKYEPGLLGMDDQSKTSPPSAVDVTSDITQPVDSSVDSPVQTMTQPAAADAAPSYDFNANDNNVVSDIGGIVDDNSDLMKRAETKGLQYANDRGLLNSSIAAEASQNAVLDQAGRIAEANQRERIQRNDQSHAIVMENLSADNRANLIELEQKWNADIRANQNMTEFYSQGINSLGDILSSALTDDQFTSAMNEYLGYTDLNGVKHPGILESGLEFMANVNNIDGSSGKDTGPAYVRPQPEFDWGSWGTTF